MKFYVSDQSPRVLSFLPASLRPVQIYIGEWLDAFLKHTWRFIFSLYVHVGLFELAIIAALVPVQHAAAAIVAENCVVTLWSGNRVDNRME